MNISLSLLLTMNMNLKFGDTKHLLVFRMCTNCFYFVLALRMLLCVVSNSCYSKRSFSALKREKSKIQIEHKREKTK